MNNIEHIRHSAAHMLAAAVLEHYPGTQLAIGPPVENGFYYDFLFPDNVTFSEKDLKQIQKTMKKIISGNHAFVGREVTRDEAMDAMAQQTFKKELIEEFSQEGQTLTLYTSGPFQDLCRGGHVENTQEIPVDGLQLQSVAGAYWRGDETKPMLTRIYGLLFETREDLDAYLTQIEEAKKRDHRKLGREMDLFTFSEYVGSGLPLYTPKGALMRRLLTELVEETQVQLGYTQVWTPQIAKAELFKKSGHYDKYKEDMFRVVSNYSDEEFFLKPMNCPQHTQIYASQSRSYRDLPLRYTDFAMLYRDERPGELNGLARVRSFSQDDCHVFCREDQVDEEIDKALQMTKEIMEIFGFQYRYRLSTRDPENKEKYYGDPATWDKVEAWAVKIMERNGIEYYDGPGEAAFYAPKMDLMATDALGREWQLSTVQIDYVQPARFELTYTDAEGKEITPVMVHRAILGSAERIMMVLIEHFAGNFPVWLSPVQVQLLAVSEKHNTFCEELAKEFETSGIRVEINSSDETVGKKIRRATQTKSPYILVIGDKEMESETLSVRKRGSQETIDMPKNDFIAHVKQLIDERSRAL